MLQFAYLGSRCDKIAAEETSIKMFSVATAVCIVLALSNGEIPIPSPLPNSSEPPSPGASFDRSDVTRYYVVDDVAFPPGRHTGAATNRKNAFPPRRHTGATNWKTRFHLVVTPVPPQTGKTHFHLVVTPAPPRTGKTAQKAGAEDRLQWVTCE